MLYISYRFSSCNSHCRHTTYIYWYSTVTYGDWGVVLFFIALTNLLVFTNQLIFLFPPSVHTVFNYMCVWAGERKGLLLCSVMTAVTVTSKNCLGTAVCCEGCKTEFKQAVHTVYVQNDLLELDQLVKMFIVFYHICCVTVVILWLCIYKVFFQSASHKCHFFNVHFNIILHHIHISSSCSVCCQKHKWNILLLHKH